MPAIARAMGIGDDPARSPIDVLAAELESKRALLVLDNLEQVRDAAADIGELLRRAPKIRVLATSRAPLRISGEQEFPVPGLPSPVDLDRIGPYERERLPESLRTHEPDRLLAFESVRLFVARGNAVRPGFAVTAANAADVAAIVAHLGGVPLAIELAAARLRFLTPAAIHERLEGRLDLPGAGAADVPERQRSLRGAIMWSHELLDPPARRLFERLAVFVGGFDLERAEAVAGHSSDTADGLDIDVLDGLASLVDQSLVRSGEVDGEPRFSMLEPIREYALGRLETTGEADAARERHATRRRTSRWRNSSPRSSPGDRQRVTLDQFEREHANLRAAIDLGRRPRRRRASRSGSRRRSGASGRSAGSCARRARWCRACRPPVVRRCAGAAARSGRTRCWAGSSTGTARSMGHATTTTRRSRSGGRSATGGRSRTPPTTCRSCFTMGILREPPPDAREQADALLDEALDIYRSLGDVPGEANVEWGIGIQHYFANDNAAAVPAFRASLDLYRKVGDLTQEAWSLHQLGLSLLKLGELDEARVMLAEGLRLFAEAGDVAGVTLGLDNFSAVAAADGDLPRAARLSGLARRIQVSSGTGLAGVVETVVRGGDAPQRRPPDAARRVRQVRGRRGGDVDGGRGPLRRWASRSPRERAAARGHRHVPVHRHRGLDPPAHRDRRCRLRRGARHAPRARPGRRRRRGGCHGGLRGRRRVRGVRVGRRGGPRRHGRPGRARSAPVGGRRRPRPDGHPHGRGPCRRGRLRRNRGPPRGTRRRGGARRPADRHGGDTIGRGRPGRGHLAARPRRAPAQGLRPARAAVPGRGGRPRDDVPRLAHARPHAQQPAAAAHHLRRPGRGRQGRDAARPNAAPDAHRARRDGQDTAVAGPRQRLRRAVSGRRVVRAAGAGHRRGPRRVRDRRVARPARAPASPDRPGQGAPPRPQRAARARQLRAGRRRRPGRRRPPALGAQADGHRVQPRAAPDLGRAGVPGPAAVPARARPRRPRDAHGVRGRSVVRRAGDGRAAGLHAHAIERRGGRRGRAPPRRAAAGDRARGGEDPAALAGRDGAAPWRPAGPRRRRGARPARAPADPARGDRLEPRAARSRGSATVRAARGVRGRRADRDGGRRVRDRGRRAPARRVRGHRAPGRAEPPRDRRGRARRYAVHDARDDPRVRAGEARGAGRDRRLARTARDGVPGVRGDHRRAGGDHRRGVEGAGACTSTASRTSTTTFGRPSSS